MSYCKVFRIGTVRYNWPMSAHASQAFSIAHCTDSEDLPLLTKLASPIPKPSLSPNPKLSLAVFSCLGSASHGKCPRGNVQGNVWIPTRCHCI